MTLADLTPWLFSRVTGGVRWGLDRTERLLTGVGAPHRLFDSLLIGGTNGKGSVAALCDAALRAGGGKRVGLYTSPHLVSFNERIRIDGAPVSDDVLASAATRLRPAIEESGASFFEATTAVAFLVLAEGEVDVAVVEVGLGGRLDATNVLSPLVTAVTNVGRDHTDYLGERLEGIAAEKGGIFKAGVPALVGVEEAELQAILRRQAEEVESDFYLLDELARVDDVRTDARGTVLTVESRRWGRRTLSVPLPGVHQARNTALAAELLGLLPPKYRLTWEAIARGFASARWPGRLQMERIEGTTWLFDVAHNAAGAQALAESLELLDLPVPRVIVAGILADKDWSKMLEALVPRAEALILTIPDSAPTGRHWDPEEVGRWCAAALGVSPRVIPDFDAALKAATTLATHGTVIVTGSVHTVGDGMRALGVPSS